jgi:ABC-type spermidine/putrescine transport system permease subunit I
VRNRAEESIAKGLDRVSDRFEGKAGLTAFAQLSPALFLVSFLMGISMLIILFYSFVTDAPPTGSLEFTLQNYAEFLGTDLYVSVLLDSFVIAIQVTAITLVLGYPVAYFLAFSDTERQNFYLLLIILPFWINLVIRTFAWRLILGTKGLVNYLLVDVLTVMAEPQNFLFSQFSVTVGLVHVFLPYIILPTYTALVQIDESQIEAAKNLGANKLEAFYEVTLPQSIPGVVAGVMIVFVLAFGSFLIPQLLGGQKNIMIANIIASMFTSLRDWALGSAMSVVFVLIILVVVYLFNNLMGLDQLYGTDGESE